MMGDEEDTDQVNSQDKSPDEGQKAVGVEDSVDLDQFGLDIYIIDSGWDTVAHRVLQRSMPLVKSYLKEHNLFVLSQEYSLEVLRNHPELIGKDPVIMVVDRLARKLKNPHGFGARVMLGQVHLESHVFKLIKMFLRIVNTHEQALDIAHTFQEHNYKEGVKGALDIIIESFGKEAEARLSGG